MFLFHSVLILSTLANFSLQDCPQEVSVSGIKVTWPLTSSAENVTSSPLCFRYERIVTRSCNGTHWEPVLDQMKPCQQIANYFDLSKCPPGHYRTSEKSNYCYQIYKPFAWNYPCYKSGKTSVITDLDRNEIMSLLTSLNETKQKFYWLPAQRSKLFNPVVWHVPGPNWGRLVELDSNHNNLQMSAFMLKNCLLLDVEHRTVLTEICSMEYPSLCLSINEFRYPSNCPDNYHRLRFMPDDTTCYGIEESDDEDGLTFDEFVQSKCTKPSPSQNLHSYSELMRYVFTNLAALSTMNKTSWCWFQIFPFPNMSNKNVSLSDEYSSKTYSEISQTQSNQGIINASGTLSITGKTSKFPCMACEVEIKLKETEFILEYSEAENKMLLTVYYPSGLWKYDVNDKGVQCFSNAKGFVKVVDFNNEPVLQVGLSRKNKDFNDVDKIVYEIHPVTYRAAQYWCEGHTKNFSLVTTNRLVVNPNCNEEHVFAIVIEIHNVASDTEEPDMSELTSNITEIFYANKVLIMDILDFSMEHILVLMHLHVDISSSHDDKARNIQDTFFTLKEKAEIDLPKYNYTFVNISSSLYCLPTRTGDIFKLNWDLTPIGHIAVPQQFCLQANGLPVKRSCYGSYLLGGTWGDVEGKCDSNYQPSWTTKFLFDFVKGNIPDNYSTHFLTKGLGAVLGNGNNIIPADIYYLSISLQHVRVLYLAENNNSVDLGDIDNVAWVMDRIMSLDKRYLQLSQTLNSTNVILDSVNDIIEHLVEEQTCKKGDSYFLTVKPKFVVQISYPKYNNVTGIAIIKNKDSNDFTEMLIQPLFKNSTLSNVLAIKNLEVATWLSDEILESLIFSINDTSNIFRNNSDLFIVLSVFYNDAVFQEVEIKSHEINSRVIGISIPGYTSNLKYGVPLLFKDLKTDHTGDTFCGYWHFLTDVTRDAPGLWAKKGCLHYKSVNSVTVCECYHLTHFGQLINVGGSSVKKEVQIHHKKVLNIITLIGSFLSLAGIIGIWVTASVFSAWRQKAGTKVLLHLSTAIAMPLIFIGVFNVDTTIFIHEEGVYKIAEHMKVTCIILGALLHYSILASFMWMFITAALQFVRYVRVLGVYRPSRFMIKCTVVGWGVPLIPISVILLLEKENYIPESTKTEVGKYLICYPSGFILIMSVIVPICFILAINIALFVIILCSIYRGPDGKMRTTDIDLIGAQFRLSIFLFFLLGLTWMFGILSFTNNLLWSYLFCLTSSLQGFVLFVYFIICDPSTRNMWITLMTPNFRITRPRESITSISSG